jgi:hypothetical protein
MTETVQLALIASIPPTLASLGALIVSLLNGQKSEAADKLTQAQNVEIMGQQTVVGEKADRLIAKAEHADDHTNGKLAEVTRALAESALKIEAMEQTLAALRKLPPRA